MSKESLLGFIISLSLHFGVVYAAVYKINDNINISDEIYTLPISAFSKAPNIAQSANETLSENNEISEEEISTKKIEKSEYIAKKELTETKTATAIKRQEKDTVKKPETVKNIKSKPKKTQKKENFTGNNLKDDEEEIFNYNEKQLKKIIESNYSFIKSKFHITNSVYLDIEPMECMDLDLNQIIENTNSNIEKICSLEKESKELFIDNQRLYSLINRTFKQKIFDRIRNFRKVGK